MRTNRFSAKIRRKKKVSGRLLQRPEKKFLRCGEKKDGRKNSRNLREATKRRERKEKMVSFVLSDSSSCPTATDAPHSPAIP